MNKKTGERRKQCDRWTEKEKELLADAIRRFGERNWNDISKFVGTKNSDQCNQHWHRVLNPKISKKPWSKEEDQTLIEGVEYFGESAWKKISESIKGRTDIQCRHRWMMLKKAQGKPSHSGRGRKPSTGIPRKIERERLLSDNESNESEMENDEDVEMDDEDVDTRKQKQSKYESSSNLKSRLRARKKASRIIEEEEEEYSMEEDEQEEHVYEPVAKRHKYNSYDDEYFEEEEESKEEQEGSETEEEEGEEYPEEAVSVADSEVVEVVRSRSSSSISSAGDADDTHSYDGHHSSNRASSVSDSPAKSVCSIANATVICKDDDDDEWDCEGHAFESSDEFASHPIVEQHPSTSPKGCFLFGKADRNSNFSEKTQDKLATKTSNNNAPAPTTSYPTFALNDFLPICLDFSKIDLRQTTKLVLEDTDKMMEKAMEEWHTLLSGENSFEDSSSLLCLNYQEKPVWWDLADPICPPSPKRRKLAY